ncbi:MAG TPA: COX15/CtaA family protein [Micromonosporaceae bacterium]|nr:COX15/CtaA family protein [Micromonosporaceae bacterium]
MNAISRVNAIFASPVTLRRLALASLVANVIIVVTGGAVRLSGSGLGCPTWPRCTDSSYVITEAVSYHRKIEFTNRTLTFVVFVLAALCVIAAWAQRDRGDAGRRGRVWWSVAVLASIPAQAVLGGVTVLTDLNPWVVACHFLLSSAIITAAYQLWLRTKPPTPHVPAHAAVQGLAWVIVGVTAAVLAAGTIVTGSGPHAGDEHAHRTGLDPAMIAQLHADLVMLLIGLSVAAWFALRATGAPLRTVRAAGVLVLVEAAQATIGFVQYFTKLPVVLVGAHLLGACLVLIAALAVLAAVRPAPPSGPLAVLDGADQLGADQREPDVAIAAANLSAAPDENARYNDGSVSSSSTTSGAPSDPGITSTRA